MCRLKKEIELKQKAKKEKNKGVKEDLKIEAGSSKQEIESDESDVEFDDTSLRDSEERKQLYPTPESDSSSTLVTIT